MQCKAVPEVPSDAGWQYEIKFDGFRVEAVKIGSAVTLYSRNHNVLNRRFPGIVSAIGDLAGDFTLDGEVVAVDAEGRPSFQLLQNSGREDPPIRFYIFDLLHLGGTGFLHQPLKARRAALAKLLRRIGDPLYLSPVLAAAAADVVSAVRKMKLEGVVAKREDSRYEPGKRTGAWAKFRTNLGQEFVLGGYVPGSRGFDSLLVGYYDAGKLLYAGKIRNGFTPRIRDQVFPSVRDAKAEKCPFANLPEEGRARWGEPLTTERMKECRWLKPTLICQVDFVEWTSGARLRHPVFIGMRDDKDPRTVVRET